MCNFSFVFKELTRLAIESFHMMKLSKNNGIIDGRGAKYNQGYSLGCESYILKVLFVECNFGFSLEL